MNCPSEAAPVADMSLIRSVELLTAAPITELRRFYAVRLGLTVGRESTEAIEFVAGDSRLTFRACSKGDHRGNAGRGGGEPMYHFAFNIPPDKLGGARRWIAERATLVPPRAETANADLPREMWDFRHWKARSLFFFDPAFNIVELIARSEFGAFDLSAGEFSSRDIKCVSEIGFVMRFDAAQPSARLLHEKLGLPAYPPGTDAWWAMGDQHGLLLCLGRDGQMWGDHADTPVRWGMFPVNATIRGQQSGRFEFDGMPHRIERVERK